MRVDLVGKKFQFHLLLLVRDHLLPDLRFVDPGLRAFEFLHHGLHVPECFRQLIVPPDGVHDLIVVVADLVHGKPQGIDPAAEIRGVQENDYGGDQQRQRHDPDKDLQKMPRSAHRIGIRDENMKLIRGVVQGGFCIGADHLFPGIRSRVRSRILRI